jgi:transposase-like protein
MDLSKTKIDIDTELSKCKTMDDLCGKKGLLQKLIGGMVEKMLEQEMEEHLGYQKHERASQGAGNSRNGKTRKTVRSSYWTFDNLTGFGI